MTANSNTCNEIELNGDELNRVIGGASTWTFGVGWAPLPR